MTSNDKAMHDFAQILEKIDEQAGLIKKASIETPRCETKAVEKPINKKAELFGNAIKNLVSLASELEDNGYEEAAELVDDALRIIVNNLD